MDNVESCSRTSVTNWIDSSTAYSILVKEFNMGTKALAEMRGSHLLVVYILCKVST